MSVSLFPVPALASSGGDRYDKKRTTPQLATATPFFTTPTVLTRGAALARKDYVV